MELSAIERLVLINQILPEETSSLRESVRVRSIRDRVMFSDEEQDIIGADGAGNFNPTKLDDLEDAKIDFSQADKEIIAHGFVQDEQKSSVPTSDAYLSLAENFGDAISDLKEDLEGGGE